ncbi:hypothetical protein BC938DRAFT_472190 [Jimgerdemannia flammicorona]|uniref:Crinkler effector protein N-terminal domain-containing protein n=1 Tax=Jimgerdemannia flammicorona TaxID=994334 RepID=A0A433QU73_9FUNG|nr:hypothetical protein BC938DRAFT_472190 [Jimgerdemannia flammicorona]
MVLLALLCLICGDFPAAKHAFSISTDSEETIAEFKESIWFTPEFHKHLLASKLTLWNVNLPDNDDAEIKNLLSKNNRDEMLAIRNISRYFSRQPPAERIHVIVFPESEFEFITLSSSLSPESKASKVKSIPAHTTSASIQSTIQTHQSVDLIFKQELEGKLHHNIAHFVKTIFPSWNAQPIADKIKTSKEFKSFLSAAKEKNCYDWLDNLTQLIIRLVNNQESRKDVIVYYNHVNKPLTSNRANHCLDNTVMYPDDVPSENQPIHWHYIHLIVEQKVLNSKDNSAMDIQLTSYTRKVFGMQSNH